MKQKRNVITEEEKILKYLLTQSRDENNIVTLGIPRYADIKGITPEQFVQTLCALEDLGYVRLSFAGPRSSTSLCYVTLREPGLTYFEDQLLDERTERNTHARDFLSGLGVGIILLIIENVIRILVE